MFTPLNPCAFRWSHKKHEELEACFYLRNQAISVAGIRNLLYGDLDIMHVAPAYHAIAALMALANVNLSRDLAKHDPNILLCSDYDIIDDKETRQRLLEFGLNEVEFSYKNYIPSERYQNLYYEGMSNELGRHFTERSKQLYCAIEVVAQCKLAEFNDELEKIVQDASQSSNIRASAGAAILALDGANRLSSLVALSVESNKPLRQLGYFAQWKIRAMPTWDCFLQIVGEKNYRQLYIPELIAAFSEEDCCRALTTWMPDRIKKMSSEHLNDIAIQVFRHAWGKMDNDEICKQLTNLVLGLMRSGNFFLKGYGDHWLTDLLGLDTQRKQRFLTRLFTRVSNYPNAFNSLRYQSFCLQSSDKSWLLQLFKQSDHDNEKIWLSIIIRELLIKPSDLRPNLPPEILTFCRSNFRAAKDIRLYDIFRFSDAPQFIFNLMDAATDEEKQVWAGLICDLFGRFQDDVVFNNQLSKAKESRCILEQILDSIQADSVLKKVFEDTFDGLSSDFDDLIASWQSSIDYWEKLDRMAELVHSENSDTFAQVLGYLKENHAFTKNRHNFWYIRFWPAILEMVMQHWHNPKVQELFPSLYFGCLRFGNDTIQSLSTMHAGRRQFIHLVLPLLRPNSDPEFDLLRYLDIAKLVQVEDMIWIFDRKAIDKYNNDEKDKLCEILHHSPVISPFIKQQSEKWRVEKYSQHLFYTHLIHPLFESEPASVSILLDGFKKTNCTDLQIKLSDKLFNIYMTRYYFQAAINSEEVALERSIWVACQNSEILYQAFSSVFPKKHSDPYAWWISQRKQRCDEKAKTLQNDQAGKEQMLQSSLRKFTQESRHWDEWATINACFLKPVKDTLYWISDGLLIFGSQSPSLCGWEACTIDEQKNYLAAAQSYLEKIHPKRSANAIPLNPSFVTTEEAIQRNTHWTIAGYFAIVFVWLYGSDRFQSISKILLNRWLDVLLGYSGFHARTEPSYIKKLLQDLMHTDPEGYAFKMTSTEKLSAYTVWDHTLSSGCVSLLNKETTGTNEFKRIFNLVMNNAQEAGLAYAKKQLNDYLMSKKDVAAHDSTEKATEKLTCILKYCCHGPQAEQLWSIYWPIIEHDFTIGKTIFSDYVGNTDHFRLTQLAELYAWIKHNTSRKMQQADYRYLLNSILASIKAKSDTERTWETLQDLPEFRQKAQIVKQAKLIYLEKNPPRPTNPLEAIHTLMALSSIILPLNHEPLEYSPAGERKYKKFCLKCEQQRKLLWALAWYKKNPPFPQPLQNTKSVELLKEGWIKVNDPELRQTCQDLAIYFQNKGLDIIACRDHTFQFGVDADDIFFDVKLYKYKIEPHNEGYSKVLIHIEQYDTPIGIIPAQVYDEFIVPKDIADGIPKLNSTDNRNKRIEHHLNKKDSKKLGIRSIVTSKTKSLHFELERYNPQSELNTTCE